MPIVDGKYTCDYCGIDIVSGSGGAVCGLFRDIVVGGVIRGEYVSGPKVCVEHARQLLNTLVRQLTNQNKLWEVLRDKCHICYEKERALNR